MKPQHTPGPWRWEINGSKIILLNPNSPVPTIKATGYVKECDARLIAAAPELLSALVIAEQEMFRMMGPENIEAAHAIKIARAAIAKATT